MSVRLILALFLLLKANSRLTVAHTHTPERTFNLNLTDQQQQFRHCVPCVCAPITADR